MWRILILAIFIAVAFYYVTLILHLSEIIRIGKQKGYKIRYIIPFVLWFQK